MCCGNERYLVTKNDGFTLLPNSMDRLGDRELPQPANRHLEIDAFLDGLKHAVDEGPPIVSSPMERVAQGRQRLRDLEQTQIAGARHRNGPTRGEDANTQPSPSSPATPAQLLQFMRWPMVMLVVSSQ